MTPSGPYAATRGPVRALRVAVLAGSSLLLAATGHLVGGGQPPSFGQLLLAGALLALLATTATARRCRLAVLLPLLAVQQLLLHLWFAVAVPAGCASGADTAAHHPVAMSALAGCAPATTPVSAEATPWLMWAAHLAATLGTAWLLARGESWLWQVTEEIVAAATAAPGVRRVRRALIASAPFSIEPTGRTWGPAAPRGPPLPIV